MNAQRPKGLEAFITGCPLGALLLLLMLVLSITGFGRQLFVQGSIEGAMKAGSTPFAAAAFKDPEFISDPVYVINHPDPPTKPDPPYDIEELRERLLPPDETEASAENTESSTESEGSSEEERIAEKEEQDEQAEHGESVYTPFRDEPRDPVTPRSSHYHDPARRALNTDAEYQTIDEHYFDNTLFIGDSRIDGLGLFSDLRNADYLTKTGVSVYTLHSYKLKFSSDGVTYSEEVYFTDVLRQKTYDHIYIMIGVNELGISDEKDFLKEYEKIIAEIRELQPDATIYILGIMNVSQYVSDDSSYLNNDNINARNWEIAHLADGKTIFYLDVNPAVCDDKGFLSKDYSNDGVHLRSDCYYLMVDFLKEHAVL